MKAHLRCGGLTFEVEGQSQKELFKNLATLQEVFAETTCGVCEQNDVRFVVRTVDGNDYHEIVCQNPSCRAKLAFGQSKKVPGMLFPIRRLTKEGRPSRKDGEYTKTNGWTKFRGQSVENDD